MGPAGGLEPAVNLRPEDRTWTCRSFNLYQIRFSLLVRVSRIECVRPFKKPIRNSQRHALLIFNVNSNFCEMLNFFFRVHSPTNALFIFKNTLKFTLKYT